MNESAEKKDLKVGIISCSGEEIPEGTLSRVAVRMVLEELCPGNTVTICLPLFLAGDGGERGFAKKFPTIAVDGCGKLCAMKGTEKYSGKVDAVVVVSDLLKEWGIEPPVSRRDLTGKDMETARRIAEVIAGRVRDVLSGACGEKRPDMPELPACSCMSSPKTVSLNVDGKIVGIIALDLIIHKLIHTPGLSSGDVKMELLKQVSIYNGTVDGVSEESLGKALMAEYEKRKVGRNEQS